MSSWDRSDILRYFLQTYFGDDRKKLSEATGYTKQQIDDWVEGIRQPNVGTVEWVVHCALSPEFNIIVEFGPFQPSDKGKIRRQQLKELLGIHGGERGIYAFYDASADLIYIGKTDIGKTERGLLEEMNQALNQKINRNFSIKRRSIVRYVSAYYVGGTSSFDYPKHVESLMLRISRPRLNNNIGKLEELPGKAST